MLLSLQIFLPLLGALLLAVLPWPNVDRLRGSAVGLSLLGLVLTIGLWLGAPATAGEPLQVLRLNWLPSLGMELHFRVDGISLLFLLLTGLLTPVALFISGGIRQYPKAYFCLILCLQSMLYGVFTAQNFFLWFLFWELSLIPAFLLIRLWGSGEQPGAALRFFIMTLAGSLLMLAGFLALFLATGSADFNTLAELARAGAIGPLLAETFPALGGSALGWVFVLVFVGLAVKVPVFPLHTWLPDAYSEAPTPVTILLTGLLSKMGIYGLLTILLPIFPQSMQAALVPLLWLAVATIVLSALAALRQTDLKRMLAYSSVNHLGYCLLGLFAVAGAAGSGADLGNQSAALGGVLLQVFNHGITAGAIFCFVAFMQSRSDGRSGLHDFGGLRAKAPVLAGLMGIAVFASLGLPGLSGFVGEFLIFKGAFALAPAATAVAAIGLMLTAVFLLRMQRLVFHGPVAEQCASFPDLRLSERLVVLPALGLILLLGLWPQALLHVFSADILQLLQHLPGL